MKDENNIACPFCGEDGFDLIGLKFHLAFCEKYENTPVDMSRSLFSLLLKEGE
jgi:hypothetical protein